MLRVASAGLKGGYRKALKTIFGTNFASLILITISILILKGFLELNQQWFNSIKILGCIYIAYLGFQILKEAFSNSVKGHSAQLKAADGGFKQGFLWAFPILKTFFSWLHFILIAGYGLYSSLF